MGKRKSRSVGAKKGSNGVDNSLSSRPSKYDVEETFANSEDEFFAGRDKILLEDGPAQKKRRKLEEDERYLEPSEEEVLDYNEDDPDAADEQSVATSRSEAEQEEDGVQDWGTSKADYYDADFIETEADALEEEVEARRLDQKRLQAMAEEDFGFDEAQWVEAEADNQAVGRSKVVEKLPALHISEDLTEKARMQILKSRYPEFEALAKDFQELQSTYQDLRLASEAAMVIQKSRKRKSLGRSHSTVSIMDPTPVAVTQFRALSAYLSAVAMYFALLSSPQKVPKGQLSSMPANELRDHAVMQSLVSSREEWQRAKSLEESTTAFEDASEIAPTDEDLAEDSKIHLSTAQAIQTNPNKVKSVQPKRLKATAKKPLSSEEPLSEVQPSKKKTRRRQNDLEILLSHVQAPDTTIREDESESDFGDEVPLTSAEAAEKARRKKSLRFYSSQIVQKASKRGAASRDAGGDDDVPHKERLRDRQARLQQQAEKRGREAPDLNERLDNGDPDEGVPSDENEYMDLVVARSQKKKAEKMARDETYKEAARQGAQLHVEEVIGSDGKRAITYAIEKNKGLMPRRKKDVRNPRVKKRKKYDEKMKKLGSVRQVYKGGEGRGGYGGELTGIKSNLVKSVKL